MEHPKLLHTALDTTAPRELAEFYRRLLGLQYRAGDEPPTDGSPDEADWLVLTDAAGQRQIAIQLVERLTPTTWPEHEVPMQLHIDYTVSSPQALQAAKDLALELGATVALDRTDDPDEPLWVLRDPAGHPFCLFVA